MVDLAPENQITWKGKSEEIKETSNELFIIFALALLTAYLVMAATFNSFIHPFVIILTCLLYTSPSPRDGLLSRMPSSA